MPPENSRRSPLDKDAQRASLRRDALWPFVPKPAEASPPKEEATVATPFGRFCLPGSILFLAILSIGLASGQAELPLPRPTEKHPAITFSVSKEPAQSSVSRPFVEPSSYRSLLKRTTPGVVSVFASRVVTDDNADDDPVMRFFGKVESNGEILRGTGSGVILTPDGWIAKLVLEPPGLLAFSIV